MESVEMQSQVQALVREMRIRFPFSSFLVLIHRVPNLILDGVGI
ncbi:MAG: hypothetical protein UY85_C0006G0019 [Candidatus Peribacteria bacterium GW2011_GWB1_54_5]|nr:MAG: hypothetical protein UY85_C0006G0019 [Candidatus Peribacteria bacterium GW2011_GWB1_54_5]KKW40171.1 MAG: hypothetical protein UY87_C0027G0004 [Candidatus Peribacteria bacterium GW2011_GWC2_54_8]KKW44101.1 MAG: hypothetical protein UY90_C0020G0008 [Candidatus Peregrinibacteria bacterium GW2011_GWA2_54_9]